MIKRFFLKLFNLQSVIFILLFMSGLVACVSCSSSLLNDYKQSCVSLKEQEISAYTLRIINQLLVTDYLNSTNTDIDNELEVAAEIFGGRVIVINSSMQIIFDSYHRDTGKTAVMREAISAFKGNDTSYYDWESELGFYTYGIPVGSEKRIGGLIMMSYTLESEADILNRMSRASELISTLIMIILAFLSYLAAYLIARPLRRLRRPLALIASGDLDVVMDERGLYEVRAVSSSVNQMLGRVKAVRDNQQDFVSNVSHELKTPMASIKVLADSLLMQEGADEATYREFLTDINAEIDRENKIISDLLSLVKMDKKADKLNVSLCNINEILDIVLKRVKPLAIEHDVEIIYESYREITAEVDDSKIIMALTNFCENAVKYNKEMGQVRVSLNSDAKYVYITVQDTGIGIPEEALEHIFERFYRVDKARDRATGGTGLGLAIANEIIRMHNGMVKVHSAENIGTTFTIRIPLNYRGQITEKM